MYEGRLRRDFRSRTKAFASGVVRLFVQLPKQREEVRVIGKQLLGSGTSVAAQVREASRARFDDEFDSKLGGALQEADEVQLWLELVRDDCGIQNQSIDMIYQEASEFIAIFISMMKRTKVSKSPLQFSL